MAYVTGRVQRCDNANGIGFATIADNLGNFASCDASGFWYTYVAYPGYRLTASAGGFYTKSYDFTASDITAGWVTICLEKAPDPPPSCCFTGGTPILLADGRWEAIETLEVGDEVMGTDGEPATVTGIERPLLAGRMLYGLDNTPPFFTSEHPFKSSTGWRAVDPGATWLENPSLAVEELHVGDVLYMTPVRIVARHDDRATMVLERPTLETVAIREISCVAADPATPLFNLRLASGHEYLANGYAVHNKW